MSHLCPVPRLGNGPFIQESVPRYHLRHKDVLEFLRSLFGMDGFYVLLSGDNYEMELPRYLTEEERESLGRLRIPRKVGHVRQQKISGHGELDVPFVYGTGGSSFESSHGSISYDEFGKSKTLHISDIRVSAPGVSFAVYDAIVSEGFTCNVYTSNSYWSWASTIPLTNEALRGTKVAVKRLLRGTKPSEFLQEYAALKSVAESRHRNIIQFLSAFRYQDIDGAVYYNFSFPLAVGNLKQLFASSLDVKLETRDFYKGNSTSARIPDAFCSLARKTLWSEFEGLANGLAYLHEFAHLVHSDIKPSNILLYESHGTERIVVAKITDFGLAVDLETKISWRLGSREARSAWQYDPPEIREKFHKVRSSDIQDDDAEHQLRPKSKELMRGDVWRLGSVFVELLTYLIKDSAGILEFRKFITTNHSHFVPDDTDARFDDGKNVKIAVLTWLSRLSGADMRAREIESLLRLMLSTGPKRPPASDVSRMLKKSSLSLYFDGMRFVNFIPSPVCHFSRADQFKEQCERWIGCQIDWRPFKDTSRRCPLGCTRISWLYSEDTLYVDVPQAIAETYKQSCRPLSCFMQPVTWSGSPDSSLPSYHSYRQDFSQPGIDLGTLGKDPTMYSFPSDSNGRSSDVDTLPNPYKTSSDQKPQTKYKEIYWCVDRAWSEPRVTELCNLKEQPDIFDDRSLCQHLTREYNRVRKWKGRYLSWKSCLGIEFIKFSKTNRNHIVKIGVDLPPADSKLYEYILKKPEVVHMMIAAKQLIHILHHPDRAVRGDNRTLRMIPKRILTHRCESDDVEEWGIYARSQFSLWKILLWMTILTVLGLIFVVFWLVFVNKRDLQNAVVPYIFLATMALVGLGIPQVLDVD